VIERKGLAGFAAPFDSYLGVAVHDQFGNCHSLLYSQSGRFGGKSTEVLTGGPGLCQDAGYIQHFPAAHAEPSIAIKANLWRFALPHSGLSSGCLPDVLLQVIVPQRLTGHCPRSVRESDAN
jgi:hypothetical protein